MKRIVLSIVCITIFCFPFLLHQVGASLEDSETIQRIQKTQSAVPKGTPLISSGDQKGTIGEIISNIFSATQLIKNQFITAFQVIEGNFSGNIPRWDGGKFIEGTISDTGTNVGIGTSTPEVKLQISTGTDVGPANGGYIQFGNTTGKNIAIDNNEIAARDNGSPASLYIQTIAPAGNTVMNTNGGNVGMGRTPGTDFKLDIKGKARVSDVITSLDTPQTLATKKYVDDTVAAISGGNSIDNCYLCTRNSGIISCEKMGGNWVPTSAGGDIKIVCPTGPLTTYTKRDYCGNRARWAPSCTAEVTCNTGDIGIKGRYAGREATSSSKDEAAMYIRLDAKSWSESAVSNNSVKYKRTAGRGYSKKVVETVVEIECLAGLGV